MGWMSISTGDEPQLSLGQDSRRWPFFAVLLTVVFLGSSPWFYAELMPMMFDNQGSGYNLQPTPQDMMYNPLGPNFTFQRASEIWNCTNNGWLNSASSPLPMREIASSNKSCPSYFHYIHKDLAPWKQKGIMRANVEMAKNHSYFKVVILDGKLYVERYRQCYGNRGLFTLWGLLLFLDKYKGQVLDVEMEFNCGDRPRFPKAIKSPNGPGLLVGYNTNSDHYDLTFPDWSFWGWSELMILSWDEKREIIINGSQRTEWKLKVPRAFWSGNPYVGSQHRVELLKCKDGTKTDIHPQNWREELVHGKQNSKLEDQCTHRYMIYTEGNGWSVSLKYILACGSPTLLIAPGFYDFFSRGLRPWVHYIPVRPSALVAPELCQALDKKVEFGEANETQAIQIGKAALDFMRNDIGMENVYSYMFHLLHEYALLQKFQPSIKGALHLLTIDHLQCLANPPDRLFLQHVMKVMPSDNVHCQMPESQVDELDSDWEVKTRIM